VTTCVQAPARTGRTGRRDSHRPNTTHVTADGAASGPSPGRLGVPPGQSAFCPEVTDAAF